MSFRHIQYAFMQHIKKNQSEPFEKGIEDRRMAIYRELFFNNVCGFLDSGFPVLKSIYSDQAWQALARQFFIEHDCRSPYFIDISKEFVEYLSNEYTATTSDPAFLQELAHYEWLELDVSVRKSEQKNSPWDGQAEIERVQMSELATLVSYHYPVHQISQDFQPSETAEPVYIVVYRDAGDDVQFTLVNAVSAHLLNNIIQVNSASISELTEIMIAALPQLSPQQIEDALLVVTQQLLQQQILLPA